MGKTTPRRKPLEAWQRADADRLKAIWEQKKPMSQELFAETYLVRKDLEGKDRGATQGLFYQYVSGTIPLNLDAALKFANGLKVKLSDISPTLADSLRRFVTFEAAATADLSVEELARVRAIVDSLLENLPKLAKLPAEQQQHFAESVNTLVHDGDVADESLGKARRELKKNVRTRR